MTSSDTMLFWSVASAVLGEADSARGPTYDVVTGMTAARKQPSTRTSTILHQAATPLPSASRSAPSGSAMRIACAPTG
jgi:hypothetical protein